ncbi:MAG TPA: hypothetical protein VI479_19705 [Blastocatellia bacterium]
MFMQRATLKEILATTLSVCLLGMFLSCMTVCAERLDDSAAVDTHVLSRSCSEGGCLVQASVAITLPERYFLSPGFDNNVIRHPPVFRAELISGRSERRFCFLSSLAPPFERLRVLRI